MAFFSTWQGMALASAVFAALTAICGKLAVSGMHPDLATFLRTIVILGVTAAIVTARGGWQWTGNGPGGVPTPSSLVWLVLSGFATGGSWICYYRALALGDASRVAPLEKVSVAFTILLAVVVLGESLSWKTAIGGLLVVAGAVVIAL